MGTFRIMGPLQCIGIIYAIVATMFVYMPPSLDFSAGNEQVGKALQDVFALGRQWLVAIAMIVLYQVLVFGVKVRGCERCV